MQSIDCSRQALGRREEGIALIVTLMVLMLVSVLMVGFVASIIADTRASGLDRDQTQAYAATHAGLEQVTSDLSNLFTSDFSPTTAQITALTVTPPALPGFSFVAPGGGTGYAVVPRFVDAGGNPRPEDPVNGSAITAGPYQGFRGIITPYDITVTARACPGFPTVACNPARGGAEVRMRRTLQTVAIPVFQFGMFSETDLAFHAGSENFFFGGRVHTNGNLFLAAATGNTLTISDRITAFKDIIRTHLPNGLPTTTGYTGLVRIPTTIMSNPALNVYRNLLVTEGSITGTIPPIQDPIAPDYGGWVGLSQGTYLNNIRNGDTGAKKLDLPIVADLDANGVPDAEVIELIRRPAQNSAENTGTVSQRNVYSQRFFALASVRILLSDTPAEITSLPTVLTVLPAPVSLAAGAYAVGAGAGLLPPLAASGGAGATGNLPANVYKSNAAEPLINGVIKIEMQRNDGTNPTNGTWQDVTAEILGLGITGRNLADSNQAIASRWNKVPDGAADTCAEPNPNAVIRVQRVRDIPNSASALFLPCGLNAGGLLTSPTASDYWPNVLYDPREGQVRDGVGATNIRLGGLMHYVELDVNNLRRWLAGQTGLLVNGPQAKNDNGFIIYFSDRRNNKNTGVDVPAVETGEYGYEDIVNTNAPTFEFGEDVNGNGTQQIYGRTAVNLPAGAAAPWNAAALPTTTIDASIAAGGILVNALSARANRPVHFRRALKIVNGALGQLPQGLTIVSENPVYVQGNYNSDGNFVTAGNVPASIIADAVTLLSNAWNDMRSFTSPSESQNRDAVTTSYRMAVVTGKGIAFPQPAGTDASFGSDGGAHNFVRSLEDWQVGGGITHRYRGSMVSFFINRQAVGTFKCCDTDAYNRGPREWAFDTDFLLPARLPPGTPMFRDVNTLTFRQLLRPTQ